MLDLGPIKARAGAATPGPHKAGKAGPYGTFHPGNIFAGENTIALVTGFACNCTLEEHTEPWYEQPKKNARFFGAAWEDIGSLVDEVERLRAALSVIADNAEGSYWENRHFIDNNVPGWIRGDDGPSYSMLSVARMAREALDAQ